MNNYPGGAWSGCSSPVSVSRSKTNVKFGMHLSI